MQKTFKFKTWSENEGSFVVPGSFEYEKDENNVVTVFSVESEGVLLDWNASQALLGPDVWGQVASWLHVSECAVVIAFSPQVPQQEHVPLNIAD